MDPFSPLIPGTSAHIPWMDGRYAEALEYEAILDEMRPVWEAEVAKDRIPEEELV